MSAEGAMSAKGEGPRVRGSTSANSASARPPGACLNCELSEGAA
jgi:hypothetical protein